MYSIVSNALCERRCIIQHRGSLVVQTGRADMSTETSGMYIYILTSLTLLNVVSFVVHVDSSAGS